ncbi:surfeit locus protein 2-like [Mytilus californianus]|uniref:surfeit locus protein 2-like n=1 Tax=Mytilus californianus TaxID=6549 RepID=UPI002247FC92|nr:surfeit locus protein 2-like [Mytilus californianus]
MSKIVSDDLKRILDKYKTFTVLEAREKIRCELSGHEMPCRLDALESYIKGKKFEKLLEKHNYQYEKQHLTQSIKKGRSHQLFCTLTYRHLNNTPQHIQKHLEGRRFKKALHKWEECQKTGETYKPLFRPKQKQNISDTEIMSDADNSIHGDKDDKDDFSDLYPAEDFEENESDDQSDIDSSLDNDEGQTLNASASQENKSDSDYEFDDLEDEKKIVKDVSIKLQTKKRKIKYKQKKQKKTKT